MPEIKLDDLTLSMIQPGEGGADLPRQFGSLGIVAADGRAVRHINRRLVPRVVLPVRFHPESESDTVYPEFPGHLSDRRGEIGRYLGGFILKFPRIPFRILDPRHLIPRPFLRRSYWISMRKGRSISASMCTQPG